MNFMYNRRRCIIVPIVSCKMNEDEKEMLEMYCLDEGVSMSWVIRRAVKEYLERKIEEEDN